MPFVYYKFKCFKGGFRSLPIDGPFISVYDFKAEIFASKDYGYGKDFDLLITDSKTGQQLADESLFIPAYSYLVICRVPGLPRLPIVISEEQVPQIIEKKNKPSTSSSPALEELLEELDQEKESFDYLNFGPDIYSIPQAPTVIQSNTHCEENKINAGLKSLPEKGFVKGFDRRTQIPPQGYVCHRYKVAGHYIQHCPTNGDPNFDLKTVHNSVDAIGISMTSVSSSNISGITFASASNSGSGNSVGPKIVSELYCPLCKNVMKDAAFAKCCFASFCDKCIRDRIGSRSVCVCQSKIEANDIFPNKTLRETINRILNVNQSENVERKRKHQLTAENEAAEKLTRKRQRKENTNLQQGQYWLKMPLLTINGVEEQRQGKFRH